MLARRWSTGGDLEGGERLNTESVDAYLRDGCGRCHLYRTPDCKVHRWTGVLRALRELLRETDLIEEMKWGAPCYTLDGKNVVMLSALKESCTLSFFKGAALTDDEGLLERPGPSSRYARYLRFRSAADVDRLRDQTRRFVRRAMVLERSGVEVIPDDDPEPVPMELEARLAADPELRRAFDALTPGRQRSYVLHVSRAKQSATRERRVEACVPKIVAGKGFNER